MAVLEYSNVVSVEPVIEPVTVAEAKRNCDVDDSHRDVDFQRWITAARKKVEHDCRRALITQTRVQRHNGIPIGSCLSLHYPPLIAVSSITYLGTDGASQTWSSSYYEVDANRTPGTVWLTYGNVWPTVRNIQNCLTVTYTCGYGTAASSVPEAARDAIMLLVKHRYEHNEPILIGSNSKELELSYSALVSELCWGDYP